ncbi:MAG: alcohol dehydrogenase [Bifidobacterium sp.]|nr:alcohol dehydrogenase [Bifidobacterium sp.]
MTTHDEGIRHARPYTWRCATWLKYVITIASAIAVGVVGTVAHRMGAASGWPYGMVLAWLLVALSGYCARARSGGLGLAVHLTVSTFVVYLMAMPGPGGDAMVPIGFHSDSLPWTSQMAGYLWIFGMLAIQLVEFVLPRAWFAIPAGAKGGKDAKDTAKPRAAAAGKRA